MEPERVWEVVTHPAWRPFTEEDTPGYAVLAAIAGFLVLLTVSTYRGTAAASTRRVTVLIALRLVALALAILLTLRPSAAVTEIPKLPSTLIVVVDSSESMTIKDEANYTRWEAVERAVAKAGPLLDEMRNDQQTTVYLYHFGRDFDPGRDVYAEGVKATGTRTDFATMLGRLYERHQGERLIRGLVILSDGIDNGSKASLPEAVRFRGIGCPVYCFAVGSNTVNPALNDVGFTSISPDPSPVAIKSDLKVKGKINAPGFPEGTKVRLRLKINDETVKEEEFVLSKELDNDIEIAVKAPDTPGEIKVSLELVDPPLGQSTTDNDRIETYLTVTREGVRVLYIGKLGHELTYIRRALATDKRFDFVEVTRASTAPGTAEEAKAFDLTAQRYDVVILGDVAPAMLTSVRRELLNEIRTMVVERGAGLLMTGGLHSLAGTSGTPDATGWAGTPIADLLPVRLPGRSPDAVKAPTAFEPTPIGLQHYLLRLDGDAQRNREKWASLNTGYPSMQGYSPLGEPGPRSAVLAVEPTSKAPLLVYHELAAAKGGTLPARAVAFAGSDTWLWTQPGPDGQRLYADLHNRFWKQMVLWLAHQDEIDGNVWVRPEFRRMVAGGRQNVRMGVRNKRGDELAESEIRYQVHGPNEPADKSKSKRADRDPAGGAKVSFEERTPGEYRVTVWGEGKDAAGETVTGDATARYVVYPEVADEMLRTAAQPQFLLALENAANGTALDSVRRADRLSAFLADLKANPPKATTPKPKPYPDWRRDKQAWFLPVVLLLFVAVLGFEWALRRAWGMI